MYVFAIVIDGLFHVEEDDEAVIGIYDSDFARSGRKGLQNPNITDVFFLSSNGIITTGDDTYASLDIIRCKFIENGQDAAGLFSVSGDVNIEGCEFDGNEGRASVVILDIKTKGGSLNIEDTVFTDNYVSNRSPYTRPSGVAHGYFDVKDANISTRNLTFTQNTILWDGIFLTTGTVVIEDSEFKGNTIQIGPGAIVDAAYITVKDSEFYHNSGSDTSLVLSTPNTLKHCSYFYVL